VTYFAIRAAQRAVREENPEPPDDAAPADARDDDAVSEPDTR
jgi:hypothetical protein